jgi:transposase
MERANKFLKLVREGFSYREIGEKFGVSRTTVYSDLNKFFPEEIKKAIKEGRKLRKKARPFVVITCLNCGKTKETKYRYYTKTFCSLKCQREFLKGQWSKK